MLFQPDTILSKRSGTFMALLATLQDMTKYLWAPALTPCCLT